MKPTEFRDFEAYAVSALPPLADWLASHEDTRALWSKAIGRLRLDDATAAIDAYLAGELPDLKGYSELPRIVCKFAYARVADRKERERRGLRSFDGERLVDCPICLDTGFALVWLGRCITAFREGRLRDEFENPSGEVPQNSGAVACSCEAGGVKFKDWGGAILRFDAERMPLFSPAGVTCNGRYHALAAWCSGERRAAC